MDIKEQMAQYFYNKYENEGVLKEKDKPPLKIITSIADYLKDDKSLDMINDDKLKEYAIKHPEMNMLELFEKLKYPVPKNEEDFYNPKFNISFIFNKDDTGNFIPKENIYWYKKYVKNYNNSFNSFHSLLNETKTPQRNKTREYSYEKAFKKSLKRKKFDKSKQKTDKVRRTLFTQSKKKITERKENYKICLRGISEELNNEPISKISIKDIKSIRQIFYLIRIANNPNEYYTIWEDDDNKQSISDEEKKEILQISYLNLLKKNSKISKNKFGPFSFEQGDSQIIGEELAKMRLETQKGLASENNNILFDEYTLFLILKAKRIDIDDILSGNQNYFKFYVNEKLLPTPVKIKFHSKCTRNKIEDYHKLMSQIKINEELLFSFAFNPILYCDNNKKYQSNDIWDYVYYIDSSKTNPKIEELFNEINNN